MEFKYEGELLKGNPVAAIHKFNDGPEECLVVQAQGKTVWFYPDGDISVQSVCMLLDENPKKLFYPGDEVTIKF